MAVSRDDIAIRQPRRDAVERGVRTDRGDRLKQLHRSMLRIRTIEEGLAARYSDQEMRCPLHLCTGQEGVAAGAIAALQPRDYVMSGHRSHGHYLAKGGSLKRMVAEIYGRATGCAGGNGGSMHLVDLDAGFLGATPIVGSTIPIAVGAAFGSQMRGEDRATMVFFGDGATESGVLHESLNFAALKKTPIVFVCENNLYSVYSPLSVRQPVGRSIAALGRAHGIEAHEADGNDVERVYGLAAEAVAHARAGHGPVFLEFATYRWREHCGPNYDNDLPYRTEDEFQAWRQQDPIERLQAELLRTGLLDETDVTDLQAVLAAEFDAAVAFARSSPFADARQAESIWAASPGDDDTWKVLETAA